uniref:Polyprotein n=1 Tax=Heracleum moellendorffii mottle spot virus TaxID=2856830 RepID=A0A8F5GCU8_9SECO|nr:polyprotein [Heracleum moellendorffii mottle spot virus]
MLGLIIIVVYLLLSLVARLGLGIKARYFAEVYDFSTDYGFFACASHVPEEKFSLCLLAPFYFVYCLPSNLKLFLKKFPIHNWILSKYSSFANNLSIKMSTSGKDLQEVYKQAADKFQTTSTSIAAAIQAANERKSTVVGDQVEKAIEDLTNKNKIYITKSAKNWLRLRRVPDTVIGHFGTSSLPAAPTSSSAEPTKSKISLTPFVKSYLKKLDAQNNSVQSASITGNITSSIPRNISAMVRIDVLSLRTQSLVTQSNAGIILTLALDSRATQPEDGILGGHLLFNRSSNIAASACFPNFALSSQESNLDDVVQIWSCGQGFDLSSGMVAYNDVAMVGEISTHIGSSTMLGPIRKKIFDLRQETIATGGLPIHPYQAKRNKVNEVIMPWTTARSEMVFDGVAGGTSTWKPTQNVGNKSIRFSGLENMGCDPTDSGPLDDISDDELDPYELRNARIRQQNGPIDDETHFPLFGNDEILDNDCCLLHLDFEVPAVSEDAHLFGTIKLFSDVDLSTSNNSIINTLRGAAIVVPKVAIRFKVTLPGPCSCPIIAAWDESRGIDSNSVLENYLQLPHVIINSTRTDEESLLRPKIHNYTGCMNFSKSLARDCGEVRLATLRHDFSGITGKIFLTADLILEKGSLLSKGFQDHKIVQQPTLHMDLTEQVMIGNFDAHAYLGTVIIDSNTPVNTFVLIDILPGVPAISKDRKNLYPSLLSSVASLWAFWDGEIFVKVEVSARENLAGQATIYSVPPNFYIPDITRSVCNQFPSTTISFGGRTTHTIPIKSSSWLGAYSTVGSPIAGRNDKNGNGAMLVVFVDAPPSGMNITDKKIDLIFTIDKVKNFSLHERITPQLYRAPRPTTSLHKKGGFADRVVLSNVSINMKEQTFGVQPSNYHRLYTIRNIKQEKANTWTLPFSVGEPELSNWKSCKVTTYENFETSTEPLLIIDTTNPFRLLVQGSCFYSAHLIANISVSSSKKKAGAITVSRLHNPHYYKGIGVNTSDGDTYGGGAMDSCTPTPGNVARLNLPMRKNIRYRSNPDLSYDMKEAVPTRSFLDVGSLISIYIPANTDVTEVEVGFQIVGGITLYGHGVPNQVVVREGTEYKPRIIKGIPTPCLPFGWWDEMENAVAAAWHGSKPSKDQDMMKDYIEKNLGGFNDNQFRIYQIFESNNRAKVSYWFEFQRPNFQANQGYSVQMQCWLGDSRRDMFEFIWRFDDERPNGYLTTYATQLGYGEWGKCFHWHVNFDPAKPRDSIRVNIGITRNKNYVISVNDEVAGTLRGVNIGHHCVLGWEYQVSRDWYELSTSLFPYHFTPSGAITGWTYDGNKVAHSYCHLWPNYFQTTCIPPSYLRLGKMGDSMPIKTGGSFEDYFHYNLEGAPPTKGESFADEPADSSVLDPFPNSGFLEPQTISNQDSVASISHDLAQTSISGKKRKKKIQEIKRVRPGYGRRRPKNKPMFPFRNSRVDHTCLNYDEDTDCVNFDQGISKDVMDTLERNVSGKWYSDTLINRMENATNNKEINDDFQKWVGKRFLGDKEDFFADVLAKAIQCITQVPSWDLACPKCNQINAKGLLCCNPRITCGRRGTLNFNHNAVGSRGPYGSHAISAPSWSKDILGLTLEYYPSPIVGRRGLEHLYIHVKQALENEEKNNTVGYLRTLARYHPGALGL